jgi:hypothetical protein
MDRLRWQEPQTMEPSWEGSDGVAAEVHVQKTNDSSRSRMRGLETSMAAVDRCI